jgi:three-Cys-motif partner protein
LGRKDKYQWKIDEALPALDEHSRTKHLIIADYLKRYIQVYMSNAMIERLQLTVVDGFAGGGRYRDALTGENANGSPFLILDAIKEAEAELNIGRRKPRSIDAEYHFVESLDDHFDYLVNEIEESDYLNYLGSKIFLYKGLFTQKAPTIIERITARNTSQRSIFILDQYAYKDVPFNLVKQILCNVKGSEIILTFNYDSLQAYISNAAANKKALSNINLEQYIDWDRLQEFKEANMWQQAIQEQLANALWKASGSKHITLFFITPKKGQSYWLVHLSKVYRARDVMMDLHWKHSNTSSDFSHFLGDGIFSVGYKASKTPGQCELEYLDSFDFGSYARKRCVEALAREIPKLLCDSTAAASFGELMDRIGSLTPASEQHVKEALQYPISTGELVVKTAAGGVRRSSNQILSTDRIEYKQGQLIFI